MQDMSFFITVNVIILINRTNISLELPQFSSALPFDLHNYTFWIRNLALVFAKLVMLGTVLVTFLIVLIKYPTRSNF